MQYELKTLEELVDYRLNPQKSEFSITSEILEEVLSCVQTEIARIKRVIPKLITNQVDIKSIKRLVQIHQIGLIEILDTLTGIIENTYKGYKIKHTQFQRELLGVQKAVYIIIEDMLSYIGCRYYRYCNPNIKVTEKYRSIFYREIKKVIVEIEESKLNLDPVLLEIGLSPFKGQIADKKLRLTYSRVLFLKELLRVVKNVTRIDDKDEHENEFIRAMIFVNFNSINFVKLCVKKMKVGLCNRNCIVDKIEFLSLCLKRINQTPIRNGLALVKNSPSIKDLLAYWVLEEICYWEKKLQLQPLFQKDQNYILDTNIKIATDLSVPQLACFIRLLVEIGAITNKRKEDVLEFYPEFYQSKRVENIEYGSFRSKYYGIQESTKEHVKDLLIKMLNELRKL